MRSFVIIVLVLHLVGAAVVVKDSVKAIKAYLTGFMNKVRESVLKKPALPDYKETLNDHEYLFFE